MNRLRNRNHTALGGLALVALSLGALAACGSDDPTAAATPGTPASAAPAATTTTAARPERPIDELVTVGDARMHLRCDGSGDTTVVLIAGFGGGGEDWGALPASLTDRARVCSYARFGTGTSDPPPSNQTFATEADDLRSLLDTAGEPGPYVVVGHSFGGAEAVTFASRHGDDVAGLMLIDASPVTWFDAVCSVPDDGSDTAQVFNGICAALTDAARNPERLDAATAFGDVARIESLGDLPLIVVTAADHPYPGLDPSEVTRLNQIWDAGQAHWAGLSTSSDLVPVDGASHDVHLDRPDLIADLAQQLLPTRPS